MCCPIYLNYSLTFWKILKTQNIKIIIYTTWVLTKNHNRFSFLTEPPSVKGYLTLYQHRVHSQNHSVWRKNVFWTWHKKMLISSNMRAAILFLNVYYGVAMIELCLWSKKSAIRWVFGCKPSSSRQGPDHWLFFLSCLCFVL